MISIKKEMFPHLEHVRLVFSVIQCVYTCLLCLCVNKYLKRVLYMRVLSCLPYASNYFYICVYMSCVCECMLCLLVDILR